MELCPPGWSLSALRTAAGEGAGGEARSAGVGPARGSSSILKKPVIPGRTNSGAKSCRMVPRNLRNRTHDMTLWGHAEVVGLCSDRFEFFGLAVLRLLNWGCNPLSQKSKCAQLLELPQAQRRPPVRIFSDNVPKGLPGTAEIALTGMRK